MAFNDKTLLHKYVEERFYTLGAEDGTRTRDPDLGKVVLYQLSYFRNIFYFTLPRSFFTFPCGARSCSTHPELLPQYNIPGRMISSRICGNKDSVLFSEFKQNNLKIQQRNDLFQIAGIHFTKAVLHVAVHIKHCPHDPILQDGNHNLGT